MQKFYKRTELATFSNMHRTNWASGTDCVEKIGHLPMVTVVSQFLTVWETGDSPRWKCSQKHTLTEVDEQTKPQT